MNVELSTGTAELAGLRDDWEDLERRIDAGPGPGTPYYVRHHFVSAWWAAHATAEEYELAVLTLRHNGTLVAVAPLAVQRRRSRGGPNRLLRWATHGDYMSFLVDPGVRAEKVCRDLLAYAESLTWDTLSLGNVTADSPLAGYLLKSTEHNPRFKPHVENPYLDLRDFADFADFRQRRLSSHAKWKRNKVLREVDPVFRIYRGDDCGLFDRMSLLHRTEKEFLTTQRERSERHSLFEDELRVRLYRPLYEADHTLTFAYEDHSGGLLGYQSCFVDGRRLLYWNTAYHPDVSSLSLNTTLLWAIVEHLLEGEREFDVFDLGAGRYPWKFAWTPDFAMTYKLTVKRPSPEQRDTPAQDATAAAAPTVTMPSDTKPSDTKPSDTKPSVTRPNAPAGTPQTRSVVRRAARATRQAVRDTKSTARRLTNPPVIWYVPHPDDETIFMGGSIHRTRDRRNILVLLTHGGGSSVLPKVNAKLEEPLDIADFMSGRVNEMFAALTAIGIRQRDVLRHDLPDGAVEADAVLEVITAMARRYPGAQHRTMSYLDPHQDHAAAGQALRRAHRDGTLTDAVFHLPVPLVPADLGDRAPLGVPDVAVKKQALREYQVWDPTRGRYAIGGTSVASLIRHQLNAPVERVHGPDYEG